MFSGLKVALASGIVLAVILGGFYWYYNDTQKRMETLRNNNAVLSIAAEQNTKTIEELKLAAEKAAEQIRKTNEEFAAIREQKRILEDKLGEHDIGYLALNKPELIERLINRGTKNAGRCVELLSGAPLNEVEKNAKNANEFNRECPWLFLTLNGN